MYDEKIAWPKEVLESILAEVDAVGNEKAEERHVYQVSLDEVPIGVEGEFVALFAKSEDGFPVHIEGSITDSGYVEFTLNSFIRLAQSNERVFNLFKRHKSEVLDILGKFLDSDFADL